MHAEARAMARNRGASIGKTLDGGDEVVTVVRVARIEVERRRVAQIALREESSENDQAMARPSLSSQPRQSAGRCDAIGGAKTGERAPAIHGQQRMLGRRDDLTTQRSANSIDHP